jgi:hypothetical protein
MFVMRYRHFRVYVNPLIALIELIIISYIVRTIPFLEGLGLLCFGIISRTECQVGI